MNTSMLRTFILLGCCACTPLLDADFDALPEASLLDEVVTLPGAPTGDRIIVANNVSIVDTPGAGDQELWIFRNVVLNQAASHSEVYFDPIAADGDESLYFTWNGTLVDTPISGADAPVIAAKLRDLVGPNQPNLFSLLTIRYGPEKITATVSGGNEVSIGNGVTGSHAVILRIDPGPGTYSFFIGGDGVSPGDGFTHNGSLSPDTVIDPENIGLTLTFADEINAGVSTYVVNDVEISERNP